MKTGSPYPLGATVTATGVNFSVFSYDATRAELLLFDTDDATQPRHMSISSPGRVEPHTIGMFTCPG